ncbi:hypothetical protein [Amycolatopsis sp. cmx-11-12]|uniref:hypothetical protein n=1 Tax=Amycolatopsis sp. cmx-11-12 TaxID=2785795 RepID=UPI0039181164
MYDAARAWRGRTASFLARAVRFLAQRTTAEIAHQITQRVHTASQVVYVDNHIAAIVGREPQIGLVAAWRLSVPLSRGNQLAPTAVDPDGVTYTATTALFFVQTGRPE